MFTRQSLENAFSQNTGRNFIIYTDIPHGRGINGIDYSQYRGLWKSRDGRYHEKTQVVECADGHVVLQYERFFEHDSYNNGKRIVCLPYERIASVDFLESETHEHGMPPHLSEED